MKRKIRKPLKWTAALSVGISEIDRDHKGLLLLLNRCVDVANGAKQLAELGTILNALLGYTKYYFQHEEPLMQACRLPWDARVRERTSSAHEEDSLL